MVKESAHGSGRLGARGLLLILAVLSLIVLGRGRLSAGEAPEAGMVARPDPEGSSCEDGYGLPNPAVVYCNQLGYKIEVARENDGERSQCVFPDGRSCDSWAFYAGTCGEAYSYCAKLGYRQITKTDGRDSFSREYAVCVRDGKEIGSVSNLLGLSQRYNRTMPVRRKAVERSVAPLRLQDASALPASFDWRDHDGIDWMTAVHNQMDCGSCWAFSAVGTTEATYNIALNAPNLDLDLSEEFLNSDCPDPPSEDPGACCGGHHDLALSYIKMAGIPDEACMRYDEPYYGTNSCGCFGRTPPGCDSRCSGLPDTCSALDCDDRCADWQSRLVSIADYHAVGSNVASIKQALVDEGPIAVCLAMRGDTDPDGVYRCTTCWDLNNGGVGNGTCETSGVCGAGGTGTEGLVGANCSSDADCDEDKNNDGVCNQDDCGINHCVVIAGYDDADGYWIVKNSWGPGWQGDGYWEVGYGECHIELVPYYVEPGELQIEIPPVADPDGPYTGVEASPLSFDGSGSYDPEAGDLIYSWDFGDGSTGMGVAPTHTYDDDGSYAVCLTVTDPDGLTDMSCTMAEIENVAPTATFNYPTDPIHEADTFALSLSAPHDPSPIDAAAGFEYAFDCGTGYGDWSATNTVTCQTTDNGILNVAGKIRDKDGGVTAYTAEVTVANLPPVVSVDTISQTIQYSDSICDLAITATDVAADLLIPSTVPHPLYDSLKLASEGCVVSSDRLRHTCTWTLHGTMDEPEGSYLVTVAVDDGDGGQGAVGTTIVVESEDAEVWLAEENEVAVEVETAGGLSPQFTLTAYVQETTSDDAVCGAEAGDLSDAQVSLTLVPVGPGGPITTLCTEMNVTGSGYDGVLEVACTFDAVPVNTYWVQGSVVGGYYVSPTTEDVLVVYDPSLGFTTGGGWFYWPGTMDRTNFGYTMKYNRKMTNVQGNLLLIRHLADGSIYRLKSNALGGLSLGQFNADGTTVGWASFTGKCTYLEPGWIEPEGNYRFIVSVEDWNEPGAGHDQFWLEVQDRARDVVPATSMDRPGSGNTTTLAGGNVVVPHSLDPRRPVTKRIVR